jgi:cytochrome c biogenesis protein CcdA
LLWTLLGVFVGGMALNLTPCVYPIIPVTISYFAGQSDRRQSRLFAHGACYVIGLAVTNSLLGVTAALTGGLMGWVLVGMAAYYLRALLPKIVYTFLLTSVAFAAGLHLGCMPKVHPIPILQIQVDTSFYRHNRARVGHFAHRGLGASGSRGNLASLFRRPAGKCTPQRHAGYRRFLIRLVHTLRRTRTKDIS